MPKPKPPAAAAPAPRYDRTEGGARRLVQLRPTQDEHRRLRLAAAMQGVPLTAFVLAAALAAAGQPGGDSVRTKSAD